MAGTVTPTQAEAYWRKYNKDGNDVLTVEEVKQCLQEVYETVDDFDINVSKILIWSTRNKTDWLIYFLHVHVLIYIRY
jgi:ribosomal protein S2